MDTSPTTSAATAPRRSPRRHDEQSHLKRRRRLYRSQARYERQERSLLARHLTRCFSAAVVSSAQPAHGRSRRRGQSWRNALTARPLPRWTSTRRLAPHPDHACSRPKNASTTSRLPRQQIAALPSVRPPPSPAAPPGRPALALDQPQLASRPTRTRHTLALKCDASRCEPDGPRHEGIGPLRRSTYLC